MTTVSITNLGPNEIHLSDGRILKPGETAQVGPNINLVTKTASTDVRVLETP